jgi:hypothetical protein
VRSKEGVYTQFACIAAISDLTFAIPIATVGESSLNSCKLAMVEDASVDARRITIEKLRRDPVRGCPALRTEMNFDRRLIIVSTAVAFSFAIDLEFRPFIIAPDPA